MYKTVFGSLVGRHGTETPCSSNLVSGGRFRNYTGGKALVVQFEKPIGKAFKNFDVLFKLIRVETAKKTALRALNL